MISRETVRNNRFTFALALIILGAANLHCWRPGIGSYEEDAYGHVTATELDLYYGWPSNYRVELWRSDEDLSHELLSNWPFYTVLDSMQMVTRSVAFVPVVVDLVFAVAVLLLIGLYLEAKASRRWSMRTTAAAAGLLAVLALCYVVGFFVGVIT